MGPGSSSIIFPGPDIPPILQTHHVHVINMVEFHMALSHKQIHKTTFSLMLELIMALSWLYPIKIHIKSPYNNTTHPPWAPGPCVFYSPKIEVHDLVQALQRDPWALRTKYKRMSDSHIVPRWDPVGPGGMGTGRVPSSSSPWSNRSGKRLHNCGKSPFSMGKLTISMTMFNSKVLVYQRVSDPIIGRTCPCFTTLIGKWW